jgi:hypothetical protein
VWITKYKKVDVRIKRHINTDIKSKYKTKYVEVFILGTLYIDVDWGLVVKLAVPGKVTRCAYEVGICNL